MKEIKFRQHFVKDILSGKKAVTWRLFDDKNFKKNDIVEFIVWETKEVFAEVEIISIVDKTLNKLTPLELASHGYESMEKMIESHRQDYGDRITFDAPVRILNFKVIKSR